MWRSFPVTAAGPFLIFTGFPINCTHSNLNGTNNMLNNLKCQEKKSTILFRLLFLYDFDTEGVRI